MRSGAQDRDLRDPVGRVHRLRAYAPGCRISPPGRHGLEPDLFVRVVLVGDDGENVLVILDQGVQAFIAHVVVRENEDCGFSH